MTDNYTIYHLHSDLSVIDGGTKFNKYIDRAKELGMFAIGFSEHGSVFQWVKKKQYCDKVGIKYIHGQEFYITENLEEKIRDNYHCVLIARNWKGVKELNRLSSIAYNRHDGHYYYNPRITYDELINTSDNIIICTACIAGILFKCQTELKDRFIRFLANNKHRCFLEVQHHNVHEQKMYNIYLTKLSKQYDIPLICGTDTHALNQLSYDARNLLQRSKGISFSDEYEWDVIFKTYDELIFAYKIQGVLSDEEIDEAINSTNKIAEMVESFEFDLSFKYPKLYENSDKIYKDKVNAAYKQKGLDKKEGYKQRIKYEYESITKNGAIDYLLLQEDIINFCHEKNIWQGYSRGSVSGSECAYLLGITDIDSIKWGMNFERFMNLERVSLSDIDIDYPPNKRDMVKNYIFNKEGLYCSDIITLNTVAMKGAVRDAARALNISLEEVNEICNNIEIDEDTYRRKYPELFKYVDLLNGMVTSVGSHPCGLICSPIPIDEYLGTFTTSSSKYPISQVDMKCVDSLNFVKLDILGLDNIQIINEVCELVGIERLTPDNTDFNDENVWNSIRENSLGIFQWEGDYAHSIYKKLFSPETLSKIKNRSENITYLDLFSMGNGAIRPAGESYRDKMCSGEFNDNGHEALNKLLEPTMGYLVYQESVLEFLNKFCGFTMGEADIVRRCVDENTMILMGDGNYKKIKDIVIGDYVQSLNQYNIFEPSLVKNVFNNGIKETYKIVTIHGYEINATKEHKVLTQTGWKTVGELTNDDFIMTPKSIISLQDRLRPSERLSMTDAYLFGIMIGDGSLGEISEIHFTNSDLVLIDKFKECVNLRLRNSVGSCEFNINSQIGKTVDFVYSISIKSKNFRESVKELFKKYGLICKAGDKHVPDQIMLYPVGDKLTSFLAGLFNTDSGYNKKRCCIEYYSKSNTLILQIKSLLLKYGIYSYIDRKFIKGYNYYSYRLYISQLNSLLKFKNTIFKFIVGKKKDEFEEYVFNRLDCVGKYNYLLPNECKNEILNMSINTHKSLRSVGMNIGYDTGCGLEIHQTEYGISDTKARNIIQYLYCPKTYEILNAEYIPLQIKSIEKNEKCNVYDISVEENHNYVANGICVHNCFAKKIGTESQLPKIKSGFIKTMQEKYEISKEDAEGLIDSFLKVIEDASFYLFSLNHSLPYSMIGYVCAYLRYYYTGEFLTVMLNINKDNIDKTSKIIEYANSKGIKIGNIKFRNSKSDYSFDKDFNTIYKGLGSIKFLNNIIADELYEFKDKSYIDFFELLCDIKNTSINSRQLDILVKLDFFSEFGKSKALINQIECFNNIFGRNQINKNKLSELGLSLTLIQKYSAKETDKVFKEIDINGLIKDVCQNIKNEDYTIKEKIVFENDYLGYIKTLYHNVRPTCYFVTDMDTKYKNPIVSLHCLCNGDSKKYKVKKGLYDQNPFKINDIIKVEFKDEPKWKMDAKYISEKNPKGWYQDYNDKEIVMSNWIKIKE